MHDTEFLIVGAGIIGLTLARKLLELGADRILIIEKEADLGCHASGRNSGILHAGIYYPPGTLKARLCLKGNLMMQEFCRSRGLPLKNSGKVIVTKNESELPVLQQLYERSKENGAKVQLIDELSLASIEPGAKTVQKALFSEYTATVDNRAILQALKEDLRFSGRVTILFNTKMTGIQDEFTAVTTQGNIIFKKFINAAGSWADRIAHLFDTAKDYCLIPFKGIYRQLAPKAAHLVQGNIYPVPNLDNPFLGVHFSKNIHGTVYAGPTAIPAFGRENYGIFQGIGREMPGILWNEIKLWCTNREFRKIAWEEPKKYLPGYFFRDARKLLKRLEPDWLIPSHKSGIRPQLISVREKKLIMDFLVIQENHTLHVLNAISPAFTSSMAFAEYVMEKYYSG